MALGFPENTGGCRPSVLHRRSLAPATSRPARSFAVWGPRRRLNLAHQRRNQRFELRAAGAQLASAAVEYGGDVHRRLVEPIVDHYKVKFVVVRHVGGGLGQSSRDGLSAIGATLAQALLERGARRRQDEYAGAVGHRAAYLAGTLPVDLQQHVVAGRKLVAHLRGTGTVVVVEYLRVLEESVLPDQLLELPRRDEMVFAPLDLSRTRLAGGVRHRYRQTRPRGEQAAHQAGFSSPRRRRNNE